MREIKFINILEADGELKEKVRQWRNREEIRMLMLTQHIISKEEHLKWIENLRHRDDWKFWLIFIDSISVGSISLKNINYEALTSEWGFYIGEDAYRGKGLSKLILLKLLKIFFDEMKFKTLFTKVLSKNIIALNLYKKFNFREIDRLPFNDQERIVLLKFFKEDWTRLNKEKVSQ